MEPQSYLVTCYGLNNTLKPKRVNRATKTQKFDQPFSRYFPETTYRQLLAPLGRAYQ